jgi:HK97 family phage major capsid protein/HK97 family phage prohead protease
LQTKGLTCFSQLLYCKKFGRDIKMPIDLEQVKSASYCRNQLLQLEETSGDELTFSFSSEAPVERWWGTEILSHEKGSARLDRMNDRGAWLFNHDRNMLLGSTLKAWLQDKRAYVTVRWSNRDDVRGYRQDCEDGHLTHVSFAYDIYKLVENVKKEEFTVTDWEVFEVSLVTIPADPSVGIGRDRDHPLILGADKPIILRATPSIRSYSGEKFMPTASRVAAEQERDRIRAIQLLAERYSLHDLGEEAIENNTQIEGFRAAVLEKLGSVHQQPIAAPSDGFLGLSGRERQGYSLLKAIQAQVSGDWKDAGLERECHRTLERQGFRSDGLLVPTEALSQRAAYTTAGVQGGGNLIETDLDDSSFIAALRNRTIIDRLGVTCMDGLVGNLDIPRQSGVSSLGWIAENTDLPEAQPSFDKIQLKPKTVGCWTALGRMVATQSTPALEELIRADFAQSLARQLDLTALHGSGSGSEPRGILNTPGVGSLTLGANGGALTWDSIVQLETLVSARNADGGNLGYAASPLLRGKLKRTLKSAVAGAEYIWQDTAIADGMGQLNGYRALSSSGIRSDLTKGTGTNLGAIAFGNWTSLVVATWGALSLEVNPYSDFRKGLIEVRVLLFADMAVRNPEAFSACTDAQTT